MKVYEKCRDTGRDDLADRLQAADDIAAQRSLAGKIITEAFGGTLDLSGS